MSEDAAPATTNVDCSVLKNTPGDCIPITLAAKSAVPEPVANSTKAILIGDRGPPEVPKKTLTKGSCFARGSNIECLHSHDDIMPQKPARRVRALGREITDRANTCSWYQNMVEMEFSPVVGRKRAMKDNRSSEVICRDAEIKASGSEIIEGQDIDEEATLKEQQKQNNALTTGSSVGTDQDLSGIYSKNELTDEIDKSSVCTRSSILSRSSKGGHHQRRLRGDVAKQCAKRNEGSIKSLIWNQESLDDENTVITNQSDIKIISSNSSMDCKSSMELHRMSTGNGKINNSSSAIQALISNSFCDSLN